MDGKKTMRNQYDFYPTPHWCYEKLPVNFSYYKTALEPCAGDGRIVTFLKKQGIDNVNECEIQDGVDFFNYGKKVDLIFTNPPYSIAQEFIKHSLELADTVIMLLRINFLGAQKRYEFFSNNEPDALYVLSKRPSFTGKGTDSTEYAWFVWQKGEKYINPGIYHIF